MASRWPTSWASSFLIFSSMLFLFVWGDEEGGEERKVEKKKKEKKTRKRAPSLFISNASFLSLASFSPPHHHFDSNSRVPARRQPLAGLLERGHLGRGLLGAEDAAHGLIVFWFRRRKKRKKLGMNLRSFFSQASAPLAVRCGSAGVPARDRQRERRGRALLLSRNRGAWSGARKRESENRRRRRKRESEQENFFTLFFFSRPPPPRLPPLSQST